ncbi:MAG TPA: hypothetical protein VN151_14240, partial [Terracidiphilus sp.]|nr:hypothetical protein [Terracidiphilus sp.]
MGLRNLGELAKDVQFSSALRRLSLALPYNVFTPQKRREGERARAGLLIVVFGKGPFPVNDSLLVFLSHIPEIIWGFCSLVFVVFAWQWLAMWLSRNRLRKHLMTLASAFKEVQGDDGRESQRGLTGEKLDEYRVALDTLEGPPKEWWDRINHSIELYVSQEDQEGWFLTERPRNLLPYDIVVSQNFHAAIYGAVPGILTGLGLTGTFLAILWALYGV